MWGRGRQPYAEMSMLKSKIVVLLLCMDLRYS